MLPSAPRLRGRLTPPGDKSVSHRALLFAALATGTSRLHGVSPGGDVAATAACLRALGVRITKKGKQLHVESAGFAAWRSPVHMLDCGNSGTTMRLLLGLLAAHPGLRARLDGDDSLRGRPMARVAGPLRQMGAQIHDEAGHAPLEVTGVALHGCAHQLHVASAQVKSALLLAGLYATGTTSVTEPLRSRDHTERFLRAAAVPIRRDSLCVTVEGAGPHRQLPPLPNLRVPGDPSSAAFAVVAALLHPDADIRVCAVLGNPTRLGFVQVLQRMGANLRVLSRAADAGVADACVADAEAVPGGELVVDLRARSSQLQATAIDPPEVPGLIDEIPILALAAACARGTSRWAGIGELRVKESDRLAAIVRLLTLLGVPTRAGDDWLEVDGLGSAGALQQPAQPFAPGLDHRMAMTAAIAGMVSGLRVEVPDLELVSSSSWPGFVRALTGLSRR